MGVEWYTCKRCNQIFCDCGDYVRCECGSRWCDIECAEEDGFKVEVDNEEEYTTSCNYCNYEDFTDEQLLKFALDKLLGMTRKELVEKKKRE